VGEGQIHFRDNNIDKFQAYEVKPNELKEAFIRAYEKQVGKKI
jgi:hypothetical protein